MLKLMLIVALIAGCSGTWGGTKHVNRVGATLAIATLAVDAYQTDTAARAGWKGEHEVNVIMGQDPSPLAVDLYFTAVTASVVGLIQIIPERYRWIAYGLVITSQIVVIASNATR